MFPFGTITSIIPLFVLAFAYVVYLGTSVISKNKQDEPVYHSGSKEIRIDDSSAKHVRQINTLDLGKQLTADQAIVEEKDTPVVRIYWLINVPIPGKLKIPDSHHNIFSIRPPPLFS